MGKYESTRVKVHSQKIFSPYSFFLVTIPYTNENSTLIKKKKQNNKQKTKAENKLRNKIKDISLQT